MKTQTLALLLLMAACDNSMQEMSEGKFFDQKNESVCKTVEDYCLPLHGTILYSDDTCQNAVAGKTTDGSISKYVSQQDDGYFTFYELGYSELFTGGSSYFTKDITGKTCTPYIVSNEDLSFRHIADSFKNGFKFKL